MLRTADLTLTSSVLDYPPFNEVIRWEGTKHVVLEQPRILGSYILMPVFGLPTLDVFKRKLYVRIPMVSWSGNWHANFYIITDIWFRLRASSFLEPQHRSRDSCMGYFVYFASGSPFITYCSRIEHPRFTRLNPPTGFTSRDWSEVIESDNPATMGLFKPDEVALEEVFHPRGPIPIPVSADGGKTLDWSRSAKSEIVTYGSIYSDPIFTHGSIYSGPMVHRKW